MFRLGAVGQVSHFRNVGRDGNEWEDGLRRNEEAGKWETEPKLLNLEQAFVIRQSR